MYKTATELGISQEEFDALLAVRAGLAEGRYAHVSSEELIYDDEANDEGGTACLFNMNNGLLNYNCGQVGCIGGWMAVKLGKSTVSGSAPDDHDAIGYANEADQYVHSNVPMAALFFPNWGDWDDITPEIAVKAIDNFLKTGDPQWSDLEDQAYAARD